MRITTSRLPCAVQQILGQHEIQNQAVRKGRRCKKEKKKEEWKRDDRAGSEEKKKWGEEGRRE